MGNVRNPDASESNLPAKQPVSRPSTAPVSASTAKNSKRTSNNPNWFDDLKKKEVGTNVCNYWSFLNSKKEPTANKSDARKYTRKGLQRRRRAAVEVKLAKETKE